VGETWLDTNYETEGERALQMTVEQLALVLSDPYRWKWVIIVLHNSLQAFLVYTVSGSDQLGAMTEKYQRKWREAYERGEIPSRKGEYLAPVKDLMERARNLKGYTHTQPLPASAEQDLAVERLGDWRDRFIHYKPGGLGIEVSGFPGICLTCLDVIEFLVFKTGHVFIGSDAALRVRTLQGQARDLLRHLQDAYSASP